MKKIMAKGMAGACLAAMLMANGGSLLPADPYLPLMTQSVAEARAADPADSSGFVVLADVVPDIIQEIRYYSTYNFVGDRIHGYEQPQALMTREAAYALKEVAEELRQKGYRLKIYDAYRPQMAVDHFKAWAEDLKDTRMKSHFYPELNKDVLFEQGYIASYSGHSRGSTVDLTLFDMRTGKEVDMGGTFDYFGERSHPDFQKITSVQKRNRRILREAMLRHGFKPLAEEWWHFTLRDEPYPDTYFTFPNNGSEGLTAADTGASPAWVTALPAARTAGQMLVVAATGPQSAWVSLHKKGTDGLWRQQLSTPGVIGRNGLGKTREGDGKTPVGTFHFTRAFGIAPNPGCQLPYTQVGENDYWSGDVREGMHYNEMVDIRQYPGLDTEGSEHIIDYKDRCQYCLNISYNEQGTPGRGSAIFLHCFGPSKSYTGGCVALPKEKMRQVMQLAEPGCAVVIDSLENMGGSF